MSRFWAGFVVASLAWAVAAGALVVTGTVTFGAAEDEPEPIAVSPEVEPEPVVEDESPRRRRRRRTRAADRESTPSGLATSGDDLREDEMRTIDMEGGGEQQLSNAQIEAGFDAAMPRIRRCLVLIAGDDPVSGRITFGLRVAGSGAVRAVQLSGPAAATTGDAGDCLRQAARGIQFATFDGPEMVVRYPITLE